MIENTDSILWLLKNKHDKRFVQADEEELSE